MQLLPLRPIFRPIVSIVFTHKLRHHSSVPSKPKHLLSRTLAIPPTQMVKMSTRSGRGRMGTGREERVGASKSLIDDEAELSDWVSGLSSSSFKKTKVYSDSEDDVGDGGVGGSGKLGKRRRESATNRGNEFTATPRRGMNKGADSFAAPRRGGSERERGSGYERGLRGGKGREFGDFKKREKFGGGSEMKGGNGDRFSNQRRNGKSLRTEYGNVKEREYDRNRDVLGVDRAKNGSGRSGFSLMDDDDDVEDEDEEQVKGYGSFKELIDSEDEVDEEDEDELDNGADRLVEARSDFPRPPQSSSEASDSYLSESRFDQCPISPLSLRAIKDAGYERMTTVQEATLPLILKGKDVMAKAKTGTGKTVAFLLPAIELVAKLPPADRDQKRPPIYVLVICPTRELASQATAEANKLLKYHPSIGVQVVIGGTRLALEQKRMQANPCQILVATPGRLRDHIENTAGFATKLMGVKVLVLDEADHLLDMGFRKEIERIISAVPKQRQTLLFSATIPSEVRQICHIALKREHEFINTVKEGSEDTHAQVRQTHLVAPLDKHFPLLYSLLKEHVADDVNYKIIVFCTTAMVTKLVAEVLAELKLNVREIHSRKPQSYRTRVSDEFRKSKGLILVTSDVSARGVDYPDVTLVVQIGVPSDKQQYIHRLGRTGRKGKEGQGVLMLAPWEEYFLSNIKDLPISKADEPLLDPDTTKKVERALSHAEMKSKEAAYQAWLGYYNSNKNIGRDKARLVQLANEFSRSMGLDNPPAIPKLVLGKMGLKNVPGLRSK